MSFTLKMEQYRTMSICALSPVLGYITPTGGFLIALIIMFGFNVWSGMRADGVTISRCRNFKFSKFKNALWEVCLYLLIIEVIYGVMEACGDHEAALLAIKSITYVFMYVYLQNAFKNLIIAYPRKVALRIIYHIIRLEFARALPSHVQQLITRLDKELEKVEQNDEKKP